MSGEDASSRVTSSAPLRVGIVGAGMITTQAYGFLPGLQRIADRVRVVGITSRTAARAESVALQFGIERVFDDLPSMLAEPDLDAVINATPIPAHYEVSREILRAGKHLVTEKPFASTMQQADELCGLADEGGLLIVAAPADMLGREWIESRRLLQAGAIGKVAFARVQSSHAGPAARGWPTDPTWFYQKGSGPLLDMGVYGIDQITGLLGPVKRVSAMSGVTEPVRRARGGPFDGAEIEASEDDNTLLLLDFGASIFATVDATFNVVASRSAAVEVFGTRGTLVIKRPDVHAPTDQLALELYSLDAGPGLPGWVTPAKETASATPDRTVGLGRAALVEHLADCLRDGTPPIPNGERARHVLDVILAAQQSAREDRVVDLTTTFSPNSDTFPTGVRK